MQDLKIESTEDELDLQSAGLRAGGEALASEPVDLLMAVLDTSGRIVSCNTALSRILGHEPAALRGAAMVDLIVADADRAAFKDSLLDTGDDPGGKFGDESINQMFERTIGAGHTPSIGIVPSVFKWGMVHLA